MNLRIKVFLIVGGVLCALFFSVYNIFSRVLIEDFRDLERRFVERNVSRAIDAFTNRLDDLNVKVADWAQWDDTYEFVSNRNVDYLEANLQDSALELLRIEFFVLTDANGDIVFKKEIDATGKEKEFSPQFESYVQSHDFLRTHADPKGMRAGIVVLPEGMLMVVSRAVTSSDGTALPIGSILFASFVDEDVAADISTLTHLSVTFQSILDVRDDTRAQAILDHLKQENEPYMLPASDSDQSAYGYTFKNDFDGNKALLMGVEADRAIFEQGKESIVLFTRILLAVSLLVIGIVLFLFERLVLRRLFHLGQVVEAVDHQKDVRARVILPGNDEFSHLATRIDTMLSDLHDLEVKRKESEKRFRTVADSAPVMIWMSDVDQKCTYVNKVWLDHTGRALEDELGHGWKEDVHPDDAKRSDEAYAHAFARQQAFSIEYRIKGKDGTYMWVFARAVPHFTADGLFLGYIGSCVDITERKVAEERRLGYIEEIEKMNRIMVERELKMIELKEKIKRLERHA